MRIDCDSQSAIFLAKNPTYHSRTKHIDVQYHFFTFSVMSGFAVHGILIPVLELGFSRLVETLYCVVNILYNAMKETKRASEALRKLVFPFRVSRVNHCVFVCECHCVMYHFSLKLTYSCKF